MELGWMDRQDRQATAALSLCFSLHVQESHKQPCVCETPYSLQGSSVKAGPNEQAHQTSTLYFLSIDQKVQARLNFVDS